MIDIYNVSLLDLLPDSLKHNEDVQAIAEAITKELQDISAEMKQVLIYSRLYELPEAVIDLLAWERHVDYYDTSLPIEQKRELVRNSIFFHRRKGTPAAVEELIKTIFGDGKVVEWFEYNGKPGYFKVITNNASATNEQAKQFIDVLNSVKRASAWLEKVEISLAEDLNLYFAGVVHTGEKISLRQVV